MSDEEAHHASVQMAAHRQDAGYLMAELGRPGAAHQVLLELQRWVVPHREPLEKPDVVRAAAAVSQANQKLAEREVARLREEPPRALRRLELLAAEPPERQALWQQVRMARQRRAQQALQ
jgi:hypothetical protein